MCSFAERNVKENFSGNEEVFVDYFKWLEEAKDVSDNELAHEAAQQWYKALKKRFFLDDNDAILYTVHGVHVQEARKLSLGKMLESTKQMLPELASRLRTQEYLSNAKKITLESDIVKKHPGLVEKLGFTIDNLTSEDVGRAHISVEDLLKQHPDKKET